MRLIRCLRKERKQKKNKTKWSSSKPKSKLKKRSSCDIVKGSPGPRFELDLSKKSWKHFYHI